MKTLNDVQIIISEDNEVSYNYKGILFTKEQFEEQFLPKSKKFVLIYTDYGDTCDGLARVSGVFNTFREAQIEMDRDVEQYKVDCQYPEEASDDNYIVLNTVDGTITVKADTRNGLIFPSDLLDYTNILGSQTQETDLYDMPIWGNFDTFATEYPINAL